MLVGTIPVAIAIVLIIIWQVLCFTRKVKLGKNILVSAFILYVALVAAVTIFPIPYQREEIIPYDLNFIPFATIISTFKTKVVDIIVTQLLGNVVLGIPFGIMVPFLIKNPTPKKLALIAPVLSICIEASQFFVALMLPPEHFYRAVDIDDVILNTTGVLIGYLIFKYLPKSVKDFFGNKERV